MKFHFMDKKMETAPDLHDYAAKKIGKIDRLFKQESEANVVFSRERGRYKAEVTIKNSGMIYRTSEVTGDLYASIDSAVASIESQIRKNKTRLSKKLKSEPIEWYNPGGSVEPEADEEEDFQIVRTKPFSTKPMTAEEAILQMNLLEHAFYAFKNVDDDGAFAVVYRRKDGGYGLMSDAADVD